MKEGSYIKLRSGDWGIRVKGAVEPGEVVAVVRRNGRRIEERVARVVWSGNGVSLCALSKRPEPQQQPRARRPQRPDVRIEYPCAGLSYSRDCHGVYVYDEFPPSSVLAGQQRRAFKASGSLEECQRYCEENYGFVPDLISGCGYVRPYVGHLSDQPDY